MANNVVYGAVSEIFEDQNKFQWESETIAKHLYEISENPRIQGGELFVCYFVGEPLENSDNKGDKVDFIGIFKTEKKEPFLKIYPKNNDYELEKDYGIGLSKLDKGALIYNCLLYTSRCV